ncbi:MAG TPA: hypothetical protein VFK68_00555 [Propionibacteriaceae bacterium]|nr:hypothetical protein [Propionibacteriaceae bacterium]
MWFRETFGFEETDRATVRAQVIEDGDVIVSRPTGRRMRRGTLDLVSLQALRRRAAELPPGRSRTTLSDVTGDIREIHVRPDSAGATFQVASQVNLLEMPGSSVTPDAGIDGYENDPTQGPACAIACGAGTLHRNYLVDVDGHKGQTAHRQLNAFSGLATALGISVEVRNGYVWPTRTALAAAARAIAAGDRSELAGNLEIGVQADTEVTWRHAGHTVTQAYCSALPLAYVRGIPISEWQPLARLVLDAAYEATLCLAALTAARTGNPATYLTRLGGGAFGNPPAWIDAAIDRALGLAAGYGLDVRMVTYGPSSGGSR